MYEDEEEEQEIINAPKQPSRRVGNVFRDIAKPSRKMKMPKFFRSFYFVVGLIFIIWMAFFDINDVYTQYQRREKLKQLQRDKVFYTKGIKDIKEERSKLSTDPKKLEKFAREKYFLKKKGEDVYVILEEKEKNELEEAKVLNPQINARPPALPEVKKDTSAKKDTTKSK